MKKKILLEYPLNASPKVLYPRLSSPGGLSEWFADDVNVKGNIYTFMWEGVGESAEVISKKENAYIRFRWVEEDDEQNYFEFRINTDELTGESAFFVTDFVEEDEEEESKGLWDTQISELRRAIGL